MARNNLCIIWISLDNMWPQATSPGTLVAVSTLYWGCFDDLELLLTKNDYKAACYSIQCFVESMPSSVTSKDLAFCMHLQIFISSTVPDHNWYWIKCSLYHNHITIDVIYLIFLVIFCHLKSYRKRKGQLVLYSLKMSFKYNLQPI